MEMIRVSIGEIIAERALGLNGKDLLILHESASPTSGSDYADDAVNTARDLKITDELEPRAPSDGLIP